jgi:hypothetical protein
VILLLILPVIIVDLLLMLLLLESLLDFELGWLVTAAGGALTRGHVNACADGHCGADAGGG